MNSHKATTVFYSKIGVRGIYENISCHSTKNNILYDMYEYHFQNINM